MILTEEPRYFFCPDVADNLTLDENRRLYVEIIRPTGYQRQEFTSVKVERDYYPDDQPIGEDGKERKVRKLKKVSVDTKFNADYILRNCVGEIKNLTVESTDSDGKKHSRDIKNGADLAECRAYGIEKIVSAICVEVQSDTLTDSKKKITA